MNLLPQKEKTENRREYFYRFSAGLAATLTSSLLIGGGLLLPSYFLIKVKQSELKTNLASLKIGDRVNVECDQMVKIIAHQLSLKGTSNELNL